jgi:hypothetical protein
VRCEKISEVTINLSDYINRGTMKDSIQLTGSAYFLDYEISVEMQPEGSVRASMSMANASEFGELNSDEEHKESE